MKALSAVCLCLFLSIIGIFPAGAAEPPADLRFSTYLGGEGADQGRFVAVAPSGSVFVAGWNFPPEPVYPYSERGSFLTGFAPDGSILFSTGFGGGVDVSTLISGMALSNGRVVVGLTDNQPMGWPFGYVASVSQSGGPVISGWPQIEAWASEIHGVGAGKDGVWVCGRYWKDGEFGTSTGNFLALLDPVTLGTLKAAYFDDAETGMYSMNFDEVAVDAAGYIYVAANEQWSSYVLMKLSPDGRNILYTVPLENGGGGYGYASLAVDAAGRASLAWTTNTPNLPVTAPVQAGFGGGHDAFVVTLDPAGHVLLATYLGGTGDEVLGGVAVDRTGNLYLAGSTRSANFPVTRPLARPCTGNPICGDSDAFLVQLGPPGSGVFESTLLGGSAGESGGDIALAPTGVVAVGGTSSPDFPIVNAYQSSLYDSDAFVSSLTVFNHPPDCSAATASPSTIWPPDRRQVRISTLGVTDPNGDPVTLKITRILQDELFTARMPDAGGLGTAKPWVRADRMNSGDGRVYHLFFEAMDPAGASCTGEVKVCVPLQSGGTCRDGGARIDSTTPR